MTTLSSREFNQDTSRAKKAAQSGPVFIPDRGKPAHVLLTIEEYRNISGSRLSILDRLGLPEVANMDFDPPRLGQIQRPADLS